MKKLIIAHTKVPLLVRGIWGEVFPSWIQLGNIIVIFYSVKIVKYNWHIINVLNYKYVSI
ncbi:MAG: hypothetical protein WCH34_18010 [Bacteroidota bacterium]